MLALAGTALCAQAFHPSDIFDDAWSGAAEQGKLSLALRNRPLPGFIDVAGSGNGSALGAVGYADAGLTVTPGKEHGTVELVIDIGATSATAEVTLAELDLRSRVAWHLRSLEGGAEYLAEVARDDNGLSLAIRVKTRDRFTTVPGATARAEPALPAVLKLALKSDGLTLTLGTASAFAEAKLPQGATFALAVTDQRARMHTLAIDALLAPVWQQDAHSRVQARRALTRLREFATAGLMGGIRGQEHPSRAKHWAAYTEAQRQTRAAADNAALIALADELAGNALAAHDGGVAALLAGKPKIGLALLERAEKLEAAPITSLALAEAMRRNGRTDDARAALDRARKDLPQALEPDAALIEARLLADTGRLSEAAALLAKAAEKEPGHEQLAVFADSANMLVSPKTLAPSSVPGPFGLALVSDLPDHVLRQVMARVAPYLSVMRDWLPRLPEKLPGRVAIFAGPVEYLSSALLVAGDNLDNVAGMFIPRGMGGEATIMACRAFGEDELARTLVHELWHLCVHATGRALPRWLDEGMAVYLSAGRPSDGRLEHDALPAEFEDFATQQSGALNADALKRAWSAVPAEFYQAGEVRLNYVSAWATVHVFAGQDAGRDLLRKAISGDAAALKALCADAAGLAEKLPAVLKGLK
ncbi:MAG: hypothetical protein KF696_10780 [Planctomycetes bacterium]|nr:hypothetical protein [Planctomycetota bacterium]MCW8135086.1 hypothetical protein [Planctomycetota bacterium]